jgi:hypothetical protein
MIVLVFCYGRWSTLGLALLLGPGCHLLFPFEEHSRVPGSEASTRADSARPDLLGELRSEVSGPDSIGCSEDQGISGTRPQHPGCDPVKPPSADGDCDGLPFDGDYRKNQDFWPDVVNPLVLLEGFTSPELQGWTPVGSPTWQCANLTIHAGESMTIPLPSGAGTQFLVQVRLAYGNLAASSWQIGVSAPLSRTCTLRKTTVTTNAMMSYCLGTACDYGVTGWLEPAPYKWFVMQLWALDSNHGDEKVGDWCRVFKDRGSPTGHNLHSSSPTLVTGGLLRLFAEGQDMVVDQVLVFAAPSP